MSNIQTVVDDYIRKLNRDREERMNRTVITFKWLLGALLYHGVTEFIIKRGTFSYQVSYRDKRGVRQTLDAPSPEDCAEIIDARYADSIQYDLYVPQGFMRHIRHPSIYIRVKI